MKALKIALTLAFLFVATVVRAEIVGKASESNPGVLSYGSFEIVPQDLGYDPGQTIRVYSLLVRYSSDVAVLRAAPKGNLLEIEYREGSEFRYIAISLDHEPFKQALERRTGHTFKTVELSIQHVRCVRAELVAQK